MNQTTDVEKIKDWLNKYLKNKLVLQAESELVDDYIAMFQENQNIVNAIHRVENPLYMALLVRRFVNGEKIEDIAEAMHYDERQIRRLMNKALLSVSTE